MMRKLFVLSFVFLLASCTKMLETAPYSFGTVENLYKSAQDAELGLTGCYNILNTEQAQSVSGQQAGATFNKYMHVMLDMGFDELIPNPANGLRADYGPFALHTVTQQHEVIRNNFFLWFAGVNRTNYLLDGVGNIDMNEARKKEILGEGHFLRGVFYTYLAMLYGGVPLYDVPNHDPNAPRQPLQEVYNLVISDFKYAYDNLPDRAGILGRANKWSAASYLAKVYTYLASCKQNSVGAGLNFPLNSFDWVNAQDMYAQALQVTQDIISHSGYKLLDNYNYLFYESTDSYRDMECPFVVMSSSSPTNGNHTYWGEFLVPAGNRNTNGGGRAIFRPVAEMLSLYSNSDFRKGWNLVYQLRDIDPTEVIDGVTYKVPRLAVTPNSGLVCGGKFRYMIPSEKMIENTRSIGSTPIIRFADILLLNAEALYYTGNEPEARNVLYKIRKRAAQNDDAVATALTNEYHRDDFLTELLEERSRELCFEAWRRIDLIRFAKVEEALNAINPNVGAYNKMITEIRANWSQHRIWFPIPQSEIDLSVIEQNPGY
ncbi:MAG: RagB/SusD family nutrient uptake outer membrane protein [Chitinophagaceae bacterium]|nr:RagB/SusD family nutrient uptake outer membrane protein [Chitinophagaceae bacterium]